MKKLDIILGIILVILLIWGISSIGNNSKIKLFESVETDNISEISIFNPGASFNTTNKDDILEIMDYLKSVELPESSDKTLPNTTPDARIALVDKDGKTVSSVAIYGDIAVFPNGDKWYTFSGAVERDLEELCKKLRNK